MTRRKYIFLGLFLICLSILIPACQTVDYNVEKTTSSALIVSDQTALGAFSKNWELQNQGDSAFFPLPNASDALGARLELAKKAQKTLDVQYFLMKDDVAGAVMTQALLEAADRGIKVRLLLDDIFTTTPDLTLQLLDQHQNIEVRIFNPIKRKGFYWLNYLGTFKKTNRRMHNKSMTADSAVSIIGGRNIADEYFALEEATIFADFDMLTSGPIVTEIAKSFDEYWNYKVTMPIHYLRKAPERTIEQVRDSVKANYKDMYDRRYEKSLNSEVLNRAMTGEGYHAGEARFLTDGPEKISSAKDPKQMKLLNQLVPVIENIDERIIIISPYFIPGDTGLDILASLAANGKKVTVITNSLATNNHASAQVAYMRYRKDLLRAGVELYELRNTSVHELTGSDEGPDGVTMHTKLMLMDDDIVFVGSLNLDPRSFVLNTEEGVLLKSKSLSKAMLKNFDAKLPVAAYRIELTQTGEVRWHGLINGEAVIETHEPDTSWFKRVSSIFLRVVPEGQL